MTQDATPDDRPEYLRALDMLLSVLSDLGCWSISPGNWIRTVPGKSWWITLGHHHIVEQPTEALCPGPAENAR